jgi:excisionase family DNA binding protein
MDSLFTVTQVAQILQVHPKTVYSWCERGEMPHFKIGGRLRFDPAQVTKWLQARRGGV